MSGRLFLCATKSRVKLCNTGKDQPIACSMNSSEWPRSMSCCRKFRISEICEAVPRSGDVSSIASDAAPGGVTDVDVLPKSMYTETSEGRASSAHMRPARTWSDKYLSEAQAGQGGR
jgi:hypothetical protein